MAEERLTATEWEREKWTAEHKLRERELTLKEKELEDNRKEMHSKRKEEWWARWTTPLVLAVLAAAVAAGGNAYVAYLTGGAQVALEREKSNAERTIEETKAEAARILEVIKTGDPEKAKANLAFLSEAGLIADPTRK